jgi:oxygen-independent coproporphyrinogen III oxidase
MSIYIHIPFCHTICSYCDFCKMHYHKEWADQYLEELKKEVISKYKQEQVSTIYIGGGTPSVLDLEQLNYLMDILNLFNKSSDCEITFECNIENINKEKLSVIKKQVNRLSIGVQTFNDQLLSFLNRKHNNEMVKQVIKDAKDLGYTNISVDLIYAIPNETLEDLKSDLNHFFELDINHISTYSLIIEPNTKLYIDHINNIDEDLDYDMYQEIINSLNNNGFIHYETSNFAKPGYESKHNLVYWNNEQYYGFGLGASGYLNDIRYTNTRSINKYLQGNYLLEEETLSLKSKMQYEMILGLRKIEGVNKQLFYKKYNQHIKDIYNIETLLKEGKLIENSDYIHISKDYLYRANEILVEFV